MSKTTRRWLLRLLSLVVLAAFGYHFYTLSRRLEWGDFLAALDRPGNWRYLVAVFLLLPINWLLEARKWQILLNEFLPWGFRKTLGATLAGVSVSAATPNRIGEIGGRMLVAQTEELPAVVTSSLLGSLCQWTAFLLLAWPALIWTANEWLGWWLLPAGPLLLLLAGLGGKPLMLRLLRWVDGRFGREEWRLKHISDALSSVTFRVMARASAYACLRFAVYCTQLYLLLWFFGLELDWWRGLAGIAAIYLVQAGIPLPPGLNLVTRTELGLLLWQVDAEGSVAVLAAYSALFGVNVLLPSLPGYWLIVRKKELE